MSFLCAEGKSDLVRIIPDVSRKNVLVILTILLFLIIIKLPEVIGGRNDKN